ncbi:spore germination protein [Paenisporosarcina quisquiliarum]|uniref:Spore germination protein n=1 Tax=Paenisporosarcina quisquiliarum TaxID=365346 RepID=A0A9X3LD46_9BACL|nr:spore germination protein [Paenisporosarcina quisquiliarum]
MNKSLFANIPDAESFVYSKFGKGESFDVGVKKAHVWSIPSLFVYMNGLIDSTTLTQILTLTQSTSSQVKRNLEIHEIEAMNSYFPYHSVTIYDSKDAWLSAVLSGQLGIVTSGGYVFTVDVRSYPGRQPDEPDNEKVIRGSRDGFTENILQNTALIRRRIRDVSLRFELTKLSTRGQTDTVIAYVKGVANEEHIDYLRKRMKKIHHDGLTMTDKSLEEWLFKQKFHPVPFVRYTERADTCAAHLLEGHIAIIVDTSPSVILVPTTIFHHLQHAEEYRQAPIIGTVVRMLRFSGFFLSLTLLPFWYLLVVEPDRVPEFLSYIGPKENGEVPLFLQIVIADIGLEFLRLAAIHTPTPLSTAMGLVAAIIIGQIAIDVGLFIPEVVLYTAVSAILTFALPSYELSVAAKMFRNALLIATVAFGSNGFFMGILFVFFYLVSIKPMGVPYLWPLVPFFPKALARILIRFPSSNGALRPFIVHSPKRKRS